MRRFKRQTSAFTAFDRIVLCSELDLDRQFVRKKAHLFATRTRGFGFWTWKPYLIERELLKLNEGDVLIYSDVGSHFIPQAANRIPEYIDLAAASPAGILAPVLPQEFVERDWNKRELLLHLGVEDDDNILDSPQFEANLLVLVNRPGTRELVRKWNAVHEDYVDLFTDDLAGPQAPNFIEHRHDQSVFSLLAKLHGIAPLTAEIDDLVEKCRDRPTQKSRLLYLWFLTRNGLLLRRLCQP